MTIVREAATIRRTGVVVAVPVVVDTSVLATVCETLVSAADRYARGDGPSLAIYGFHSSTGHEVAVAVWHVGPSAVGARPDIAAMLGLDVVDAIRIDSFTVPDDGPLAVRAEVFLLRIARAIADAFGGIVCDDVGAIYDPLELDALVAAGRPRALAFSFEVACAERAADVVAYPPLEDVREDWPDLNDAVWPSDCVPDVVLDVVSLFVVAGRYVPITTAARIAVVASLGGSRPIVVFAPNLATRDGRVLAAAGVVVASSTNDLEQTLDKISTGRASERLIADTPFTRDEIALFGALEIGVAEVRTFLERRALEMATISADDDDSGQAAIVRMDDVVAPQALPVRLARLAFKEVVIDAYHLDLERAHPLLRALVAQRAVVRELLGAPIRSIVVFESIGTTVRTRDADVVTVSLLAELAAAPTTVVQDDAGATFDARSLLRLAMARTGRDNCWQERVALAALGRNSAEIR